MCPSRSLCKIFEKLGVFYLGKHYDLDKHKLQEDLLLYESKRPDHPCRVRGHDRQRQDRVMIDRWKKPRSTASRPSPSIPRETWAICCWPFRR